MIRNNFLDIIMPNREGAVRGIGGEPLSQTGQGGLSQRDALSMACQGTQSMPDAVSMGFPQALMTYKRLGTNAIVWGESSIRYINMKPFRASLTDGGLSGLMK